MNELVIPLIAVIGTFSALITYIFLRYTTRNKERMSLIEHGKEANIFREQNDSLGALKYGLLMVFAGVGFFIGFLLYVARRMKDRQMPLEETKNISNRKIILQILH